MADAETEPYLYIELDEALALFAEIKGLSLGAARAELRDEARLESALMRPRHAADYEGADLAQQAALLLCGIAETQAFVDGNKRTALVVAFTFLELNGYVLDLSEDEMVQLMFEIADDKPVTEVAVLVRSRLRPAG